jgi:hypothetical protein
MNDRLRGTAPGNREVSRHLVRAGTPSPKKGAQEGGDMVFPVGAERSAVTESDVL